MVSQPGKGEMYDDVHLFRALFEHMAEGVALHEVICDEAGQPKDYRILDINDAYTAHTGITREMAVGRSSLEAYGVESPPYMDEFMVAGHQGRPHRFETYFAPLNRHFSISVAPMGAGYFATIFTDITEHKRLEAQRLQSEQKFTQVFDLAPSPISVSAMDGRIISVNRAFCELLGSGKSELVGRRTIDLGIWVDPSIRQLAVERLQQEGRFTGLEAAIRTLHGDVRTMVFSGATIELEGTQVLVTAANDVTSVRAAERAEREASLELERYFELSLDLMCIANLEGQFVRLNPAWERVLGYPLEALVGACFLDYVHPLDLDSTRQTIQVLGQNEPILDFTNRFRCRDGTYRHIEWRTMPVGGGLVYAVARDVTERHDAEQTRLRLEEKLLQSQKLESLGVLAGGIAHDFNNLLTGILGNASLALDDLSESSPVRSQLVDIEEASGRAADLCKQLLAYSGKGRFVVESVSLNELVKELAHLLSVTISKKVALKYELCARVPPVMADAAQIAQIVMNLITNAAEAYGDSSGVVSLTTGTMYCDEAYLRSTHLGQGLPQAQYSFVEVSDTGCGMDSETLARVFDPFFTTKFTGRGLGLAAVLGIVRGHQGAISIYTEVNRGTTFKVLLPSTDSAVADSSHIQEPSTLSGSGLILVVDDEATVRAVARGILERAGYSVLEALDGEDAVIKFRQHAEDIRAVVLDLTMPHLDGEACFREMRGIKSDVKVLMTSGYNEQDVANRFVGKGTIGFVQKPFTQHQLLSALACTLGDPEPCPPIPRR